MNRGDLPQSASCRIVYVCTLPLGTTIQSLIDVDLFAASCDEVHVLALSKSRIASKNTTRLLPRVWCHTVVRSSWLKLVVAAVHTATQQLVFAKTFRADLIIVHDLGVASLCSVWLSFVYKTPLGVQLSTFEYAKQTKSLWRRWWLRFVLSCAAQIQVTTKELQSAIQIQYSQSTVTVIPRLLPSVVKSASIVPAHLPQLYQPLQNFIVFAESGGDTDGLHFLCEAAQYVLQRQQWGLIALGPSLKPAKFAAQLQVLGVHKQVIFPHHSTPVLPSVAAADFLVVTDQSGTADAFLLQAMVAGTPVIAARTPWREELFVHGESILFFTAGMVQELVDCIDDFVHDVGLRAQCSANATQVVRRSFYSNRSEYIAAYQQTLVIPNKPQLNENLVE